MLDFERSAPRPSAFAGPPPWKLLPLEFLQLVFRAPWRSVGACWLALLLAQPGIASAGSAGPAGAVEYGFAAGAHDQRTHAIAGIAAMPMGAGSAFGVVTRWDDTVFGDGFGFGGGAAWPLGYRVIARGSALRNEARSGADTWRLRAGPQLLFENGAALGLAYTHEDGTFAVPADGVSADFSIPFLSVLTGRGSASYAGAGSITSLGGALGLGWRAQPRMELTVDVGVAKNAAGVTGFEAGAGTSGRAVPVDEVTVPVFLGLRVLMP
jgi:hypothetical protein